MKGDERAGTTPGAMPAHAHDHLGSRRAHAARCAGILVLLATLTMVGLATPALGHAEYIDSDPPRNARLEEAPTFVEVELSEHADPAVTSLVVTDGEGERVDRGDVEVRDEGAHSFVRVSLQPLVEGAYLATWRTTSLTDGHTTSGSWGFAVGDAVLPSDPETTEDWPWMGAAARSLLFLGFAAAFGSAVFLLFVDREAVLTEATRRLIALLAVGCGLQVVGIVLIGLDGARGTERSLLAFLTGTRVGNTVTLRLLMSALALVTSTGALLAFTMRETTSPSNEPPHDGAAAAHEDGPPTRRLSSDHLGGPTFALVLVAMAAAVLSAVGRALLGHVTAATTLLFVLDLFHLVLGAAWVGGLVLLGAYATTAKRSGFPEASFWRFTGRFARFAFWSFLAVLVTGLVLVAIILGPGVFVDPQRLMASKWGGFVAAKLVLMGAMLVLAAANRHVVLKGTRAGEGDAGSAVARAADPARTNRARAAAPRPTTLRTSVALEALLGIAVLVCAGFLTSLSPALGGAEVGAEREPYTLTSRSDEFLVTMTLDPSPIAQQATNMTLLIQERRSEAPVTSATRIVVETRLVAPHVEDDDTAGGAGNDTSDGTGDDDSTGEASAERFSATHVGEGHWWVADLIPVRAGHYEVEVTIQTPEVYLDTVFLSYHVYPPDGS